MRETMQPSIPATVTGGAVKRKYFSPATSASVSEATSSRDRGP